MKTRAVKWALGIVLALIVVVGTGGYFVASRVLDWGTGLVLKAVESGTLTEKVDVTSISCAKAKLRGPRKARWQDVQAEVVLTRENPAGTTTSGAWRGDIDHVDFRWAGLLSGTLHVALKDVRITRSRDKVLESTTRDGQAVSIRNLEMLADRIVVTHKVQGLSPVALKSVAVRSFSALNGWRRGEPAELDIDVDGGFSFDLNGEHVRVGLKCVEVEGGTALVASEADVRKAVAAYGDWLTDAEVEIAARNPLRLPRLLQVKAHAEKTVREHYEKSTSPEGDAYRHLAWSWLLCDAFDPAFAERVAEAHEVGGTNAPDESARDRANNETGRLYWQSKVPFQDLKSKVKTDPRVAIRGRTGQ